MSDTARAAGVSEQARLTAERTAGGVAVWRKRYPTAGGAHREAQAYEALRDLQGGCLPRLLDADVDAGWLLVEHIDGQRGDEHLAQAPADEAVFAALGRCLRALADVSGPDTDPLSLPDAVRRRRDGWLARGRAVLSRAEVEAARRLIEPSAFAGRSRTWCHRDLRPANWIVTGDTGRPLVLIDLGQARMDAAEVDLAKLVTDVFWQRSDEVAATLEAALLARWGLVADAGHRARVRSMVALHALGTRVWASHRGAAAEAVRAGRWLRRLGA